MGTQVMFKRVDLDPKFILERDDEKHDCGSCENCYTSNAACSEPVVLSHLRIGLQDGPSAWFSIEEDGTIWGDYNYGRQSFINRSPVMAVIGVPYQVA